MGVAGDEGMSRRQRPGGASRRTVPARTVEAGFAAPDASGAGTGGRLLQGGGEGRGVPRRGRALPHGGDMAVAA